MAQMIEMNLKPDAKILRQFGFIAVGGFGFVAAIAHFEVLIFAVLYFSTVTVYERRIDENLDRDLAFLIKLSRELSSAELALLVDERSHDVAGEHDEYLLVDGNMEYVAVLVDLGEHLLTYSHSLTRLAALCR